jgi:hypothetical protein
MSRRFFRGFGRSCGLERILAAADPDPHPVLGALLGPAQDSAAAPFICLLFLSHRYRGTRSEKLKRYARCPWSELRYRIVP